MPFPPREDPSDDDIDARFAEIVAQWSTPTDEDAADRRPAAEEADETDAPTGEDQPTEPDQPTGEGSSLGPAPISDPRGEPLDDAAATWPPSGAPAGAGWRDWAEPEIEEHFVPPTPPLPAGDLHLWGIVLGLLGGPLILALSTVAHVLRAPFWPWLGVALSITGVVLLFLRLPKQRDDDASGGAAV